VAIDLAVFSSSSSSSSSFGFLSAFPPTTNSKQSISQNVKVHKKKKTSYPISRRVHCSEITVILEAGLAQLLLLLLTAARFRYRSSLVPTTLQSDCSPLLTCNRNDGA
jgi:hypothetical protein